MTAYGTDGSGTLGYRVVIDGCPYQPVSHPAMASASTSIGGRKDGLRLQGERFSIKADPIQCKLDVGGFQISIVDIDNVWSTVFDVEPVNVTWLTSTINATQTTVPVQSTSGWDSAGYLWIDGECIQYTSTTADTFLGCTRGVLSPDAASAQYHYYTDGVRLRTPEATSWPVLWENRRVVVYRYDEGDSLTGDGTQIYRGVVTSAPRFNGTTWTLGVDHVISVLEQTFGEDLDIPLHPRGIHYTTMCPFQLSWYQYPTAGGSVPINGAVSFTGFWETQDAFCDSLNTALSASLSAYGGSGSLTAVSQGNAGWYLRYHTDAATPMECQIKIGGIMPAGTPVLAGAQSLDPALGALPGVITGTVVSPQPAVVGVNAFPQAATGVVVGDAVGHPLAADTDYFYFRPMSTEGVYIPTALGTVPRGVWTYTDDSNGRSIYLDSATPISSSITAVVVSGTDPVTGEDYTDTYGVSFIDTTARYITLTPFRPSARMFLGDKVPEVRLGLQLQTTHPPSGTSVAYMLDYVVAQAAQYSTLGVMPSLRAEDIDSTAWHTVFDSLPPINTQRLFVTFSPVSLADIVREELKAAGCFLALDNQGRLVPKRIRLAPQSEASAIATIDSYTLLTDKQRATHEVSGYGQINQITYKDGFDPASGDFMGNTFRVRDVAAFGQSSSVREMQVSQRSQFVGYTPIDQPTVLMSVADPIFGALAGQYSVDTIDAAKSESAAMGDAIVFDDPYLVEGTGAATSGIPNATLGVTGRVGLVLGKEWETYSPRVRFTVLNTKQKIAGYAPEALVSAEMLVTGNTWSIDLDSSYFPSGTTADDFFVAADVVRVVEWNVTSATIVSGTVVSASGNTVVVTFGGVWTPGGSSWYLTTGTAANVVSTQMKYCFIADANGVIDSGGSNQTRAKVFAP